MVILGYSFSQKQRFRRSVAQLVNEYCMFDLYAYMTEAGVALDLYAYMTESGVALLYAVRHGEIYMVIKL